MWLGRGRGFYSKKVFFIIYYWTFTLSLHGKFPLGENDSASAFFYQRSRNRHYVNSTNCFPSLNFFGLKSFSFFKFLYQDESHWHHASFSLKVWLEKKDEQQLVRGVKHFFVLFCGKNPVAIQPITKLLVYQTSLNSFYADSMNCFDSVFTLSNSWFVGLNTSLCYFWEKSRTYPAYY